MARFVALRRTAGSSIASLLGMTIPFLLALSRSPCFKTCCYFKTPKTLTTKDTKYHEGLDSAGRVRGTAGDSRFIDRFTPRDDRGVIALDSDLVLLF